MDTIRVGTIPFVLLIEESFARVGTKSLAIIGARRRNAVINESILAVSAMLTVVAIIGKLVSGLWVGGGWNKKISTGIAMIPRGEVGLIFAEVGRRSKIFDDSIYAVIVFVVAFTTLLAPLALKYVMADESEVQG